MGQSWYIIFILVLLNFRGSVSAPVRVIVKGFVGDSAVLSCSIPENEVQDKKEKYSVHWRDDDGKSVCDIIEGNRTCQDQSLKYKNRVETSPEEHKKGTFSIKLNGLQNSDARKYHCYITEPIQHEAVIKLLVEEKPGGRGNHREPSLTVLFVSLFIAVISALISVVG